MLKEKLQDYLGRKELSKKAVDEIVSILAESSYTSNDSLEELVGVLFALKPDAIYAFVCKEIEKIPEDSIFSFLELSKKTTSANKFTHAFLLSIALHKQSKFAESYAVLSYIIQNYILVQKVNKQIYSSFERCLHYEGAEYLFGKWESDDERIKNGYKKLLIEFLKVYPKIEYAEMVTKWYNENEISIHNSEQEVIAVAMQAQITAMLDDSIENKSSAQSSKKESLDLTQIPMAQLLEAVHNQFLSLSKRAEDLANENKKLKDDGNELSGRLKTTELSLKTAQIEITGLTNKIKTQECTIAELSKELSIANEKIVELNKTIETLNGKLANVESAYGHAGQQEIDYMRGQIKKRLASEYTKYVELKEKEPDLDYYVILLDMLDEIYHVLGKNGIKFD